MHNIFKYLFNGIAKVTPPGPSKNERTYTYTDSNGIPHYTIDKRALERNKYAPWGRGHLGGRAIK